MISDLKRRADNWLQDKMNEIDARISLIESQINERYENLNGLKKEFKEIEYELKLRRNENLKKQRTMMEENRKKQLALMKKQQEEAKKNANVPNQSDPSKDVDSEGGKKTPKPGRSV